MLMANNTPIHDLDLTELLMQFKVMKALGYHSLFDEGFRREMRNPFRRILYYKLVSASDTVDAVILGNALKDVSDRIGFYTNPELAQKVRQQEIQTKLADMEYSEEVVSERQRRFDEARKLRGEL